MSVSINTFGTTKPMEARSGNIYVNLKNNVANVTKPTTAEENWQTNDQFQTDLDLSKAEVTLDTGK